MDPEERGGHSVNHLPNIGETSEYWKSRYIGAETEE